MNRLYNWTPRGRLDITPLGTMIGAELREDFRNKYHRYIIDMEIDTSDILAMMVDELMSVTIEQRLVQRAQGNK